MNIFYLDKDPQQAAKYHCDKHVVKMILESAQILCTIVNEASGSQCTPYKSTHKNHPCTLWAGRSIANAKWLWELTKYLNEEYRYRFNHDKDHKSWAMLKDIDMQRKLKRHIPMTAQAMRKGITTPAQAMPDYLKSDDAVFSYRLYYQLEKQHLLKYTRREMPEWLEPCTARVV